MNKLPFVSVITPVYNSERVIAQCLDSVAMQDYPKQLLEVVIADASSKDRTLEIVSSYKDRLNIVITGNTLQTGEAGKAAAVKVSRGEILAFIDSDNIMPEKDFIKKMVAPFALEENLLGSEPISFECRKQDASLTRYFACAGINDPLCLFIGNYDRYSYITGKWTGMKLKTEKKQGYVLIELDERKLPTIGANGTFLKAGLLKKTNYSPYLFDIDAVYEMMKLGAIKFAKVNIGIVHLYSPRFGLFFKKQDRRVKDFLHFNADKKRSYPWSAFPLKGIVLFSLSCITVVPLFLQALAGFIRKPALFWLWHIPVCFATFLTYALEVIRVKLTGKTGMKSREGYGQ